MGTIFGIIFAIIGIIIFINHVLPLILAGLFGAMGAAGEGNNAGCVVGLIIAALGILLALFMFGVI